MFKLKLFNEKSPPPGFEPVISLIPSKGAFDRSTTETQYRAEFKYNLFIERANI